MWDKILDFFEAVGDFFSTIFDFISDVFDWIGSALPVILLVIVILFFMVFGIFNRGCGYQIYDTCIDNSGSNGYSDKSTFAVEGEHYSTPQLTFEQNGDQGRIVFRVELYQTIRYDLEICVMQNGVNLYSYTVADEAFFVTSSQNVLEIDESFTLSNYKPGEGEIYYFINYFNGIVDRKD